MPLLYQRLNENPTMPNLHRGYPEIAVFFTEYSAGSLHGCFPGFRSNTHDVKPESDSSKPIAHIDGICVADPI